jgi:dTMP kinase
MNMKRAKFITFEGCEGSGKSTQSSMLYEYLMQRGKDVVLTREPGGTVVAEKIRNLIVNETLHHMTELLLIMAARFEHVTNVIKPALLQNKWVICDRFIDSTLSYQGKALDMSLILKLHNDIYGDFMPDLTFFIDLEPSLSLLRAVDRGGGNKFEHQPATFHEDVYNNFVALSQQFEDRIVVIDGASSALDIHQKVVSVAME